MWGWGILHQYLSECAPFLFSFLFLVGPSSPFPLSKSDRVLRQVLCTYLRVLLNSRPSYQVPWGWGDRPATTSVFCVPTPCLDGPLVSHFVSLLCHSRLGGERDILLTPTYHIARVFPAPSPGQPSPVPPFCTLGGGAFSPHGPPLSSWPSLISHTLVTAHLSLSCPSGWLLCPHSPCLSSPPFSVSLPTFPGNPGPHSLPGLFFTPLSPVSWLMPSPVLILNNYQIYQWGERRHVRVVLASQSCGPTGCPLPVHSVG